MQLKWNRAFAVTKRAVTSSSLPASVQQGLVGLTRKGKSLQNTDDAQNLTCSSNHLSGLLLLFVHTNVKNPLLVQPVPEAMKQKTPEESFSLNTRLQLTTVWSGCRQANRATCHGLKDVWNSTPGLSAPRHQPLLSWFKDGGLQED